MFRVVAYAARDYDLGLVALGCVVCVLAAHTGLRFLNVRQPNTRGQRAVRTGATILAFSCGVWATHFIGILAYHNGVPPFAPRTELVAAGGACFLLLLLALAAAVLDHRHTTRLTTEASRFRGLADATFEGLIFEREGFIADANRAMCRLAGMDAAAIIGRPLIDLIPGLALLPPPPRCPADYEVLTANGQVCPVEVLWRDGPERGARVVAVRDIARQNTPNGQTAHPARFDTLTGLANRDMFKQRLRKALVLSDRSTIGVALLYVDLDQFNTLNKTLGMHAGEQLLVQAARRLAGTARRTGTVARLGRDAFAIIQPLVEQPMEAALLADRIVTEMSWPFSVDGQPVDMTASVGVALYPADGIHVDELLKCAALALRKAKHDGRGQWRYFDSGTDKLLRAKRSVEHDLRIALKEGQFSLNYQPFVDTASLDIAGYEALLRWDHPERGRIPPSEFIPLAEESGVIVPLGSWVLATACAEAASWEQPVTISVNLSPAQFVEPGIVSTVAEVLRRTGLPPNRLELEITEGTLMDDTQKALRILTSLKSLGVTIAMDDFGTGYSSLSYLRKFPFDKIKIDRSFISDLGDNSDGETIVEAIIAMGRSLHLDVTAEGVETRHQLDMLRAHGCKFVQGYLLGRPCAAAQLDIRTGKTRWKFVDHAFPAE